ncbi:MAG: YesL family protein [Lachnospiraceae bacterium]|nr:YesL family protein [Lachnospiraceae bacterium]
MNNYFEVTAKIWSMFLLSIIYVICCIPIFTIGAATTSYCYMLFRFKDKREGRVIENYFISFKKEFVQSTKVWGIMMVALVILYFDSVLSSNLVLESNGKLAMLYPMYYLLLFLVMAVLIYVFAYMARFKDGVIKSLKNSFLIATRHLGYTITIMLIDYLIIKVGLDYFLPVTIITPLLIGWVNVSLLNIILKKYES